MWVQIFADALQIPIDVIEDKELERTRSGDRSGIAAGVYADYEEESGGRSRSHKTVQPRPEYGPVYEKNIRTIPPCDRGLEQCVGMF